MTVSKIFIDTLIEQRDDILREYLRYKRYLSVKYNYKCRTKNLRDDSTSRRLILINRGKKYRLNCLMMSKTTRLFSSVQKLENLLFSDLGPKTTSNVLNLYSDQVTRYALSLYTPGPCGHVIDGVCYRSDQLTCFSWQGTNDFFAFNDSDLSRVLLVFDTWN